MEFRSVISSNRAFYRPRSAVTYVSKERGAEELQQGGISARNLTGCLSIKQRRSLMCYSSDLLGGSRLTGLASFQLQIPFPSTMKTNFYVFFSFFSFLFLSSTVGEIHLLATCFCTGEGEGDRQIGNLRDVRYAGV